MAKVGVQNKVVFSFLLVLRFLHVQTRISDEIMYAPSSLPII